ncbi:hypothetical protein [Parapedobacter tibetensis]|uniref:hypothetical protein n=1 Tax=Parapedobacter tibetensis TaxID=2972951 RepID=UPI00214D7CD3|nr:hypothetical protein [Parapedobacter tibetensis]
MIQEKILTAKRYYSGFKLAHDTYNAISVASDGKVYYVLSSESYDIGGQIYVYDPQTDKTSFLADLTEICGENGRKTIPQGKSHVRFYEFEGKLYFATHVGVYDMRDDMERLHEVAPSGYALYPGGHLLSYDLASGTFDDLAITPEGEGILTMTIDGGRGHIYALTWPMGCLLHYDMKTRTIKKIGLPCGAGEAGKVGDDYRVICRSMFVDPQTGTLYFSTAEGDIMTYRAGEPSFSILEGVDMRLDYFGKYDPTRPGSMGYNWRKIFWHAPEQVAYGVHGNSGYLFRFDPATPSLEIVRRITSVPSQRSGMFDQFSYGYLGFQPGKNGETIYYLTGGPIYVDGQRIKGANEIAKGAAKGLENLHLVTYNIRRKAYRDHGAIFYEDGTRPTYVNSIAIDDHGDVYVLARFEQEGVEVEDLIKIANPFN